MTKRKILIQLDSDPHPSVFDRVVAIDAGADEVLSYGGVKPADVRNLVYGAIFTRGPKDLKNTAIFIGGSDVGVGELLLEKARQTFFGPLRVSMMLDSSGANTTAAAAVLAAERHLPLTGAVALVLGGTGPVGQRVVRLLAGLGTVVRVGSRRRENAERVCTAIREIVPGAQVGPVQTEGLASGTGPTSQAEALAGVQLVIAAGAAGVTLLGHEARLACNTLKTAVDLNAVPPVGIEGIDPIDKGTLRDGANCYGAIGVGGTKMQIHKWAVERLFDSNDWILNAEEIYAIGKPLG